MERIVLILGGLLTTAPGVLAFRPALLRELLGLEFIEQYTILVQHWGFMVGLLGLMMIAAAFVPKIRFTVMLYAVVEKYFMVYLYLQYRGEPFAAGFLPAAVMDSALALCMTACLLSTSCPSNPSSRQPPP